MNFMMCTPARYAYMGTLTWVHIKKSVRTPHTTEMTAQYSQRGKMDCYTATSTDYQLTLCHTSALVIRVLCAELPGRVPGF